MSFYLVDIIATMQQLKNWVYEARKKNNVDWMCLIDFSINISWIWDCEVKSSDSRDVIDENFLEFKKRSHEMTKDSSSSLCARMRKSISKKSCVNERYDIWCLLWAIKMRKLEKHINMLKFTTRTTTSTINCYFESKYLLNFENCYLESMLNVYSFCAHYTRFSIINWIEIASLNDKINLSKKFWTIIKRWYLQLSTFASCSQKSRDTLCELNSLVNSFIKLSKSI